MEVNMYSYPPGDPQLIDRIYNEFLSQGRFDKLRKECMANADTKPAYQNLQQRVENTVTQFLRKQTWKPELNKNQLRDQLRKHILESGFLDAGINRIVDQVVNPNVLATVFLPEVEEVVYSYFNIPRPVDKQQRKNFSSLMENDMNPPGVVEINDLKSESESDQNVDSEGNRSEILFDRLKKEDEEARRDSKDGNFENELKEKKSNINDSTESLFEKISNESFSLEEKSDAGNNDSKEIMPMEDMPDNKNVVKMELPSDDSQESLSRMGVEKLQINEADNATNGHDSDSQGPLEIDERTMSDSENSNDSILQQMSPISQGRMSPDPEDLEIKQEPNEKKEELEQSKQETESEKPKERLPILEEKNPSTFVGRIPKIKKEDEEDKSKEKTEVKSAESSDDSASQTKSDFDDKKKAEEKKDEKSRDRYKDDKKQRDDKSKRKDDKSRRDRSREKERERDRDRDRKRDDKSKKKDDRDKDRDRDRDRDKDKARDKDKDKDKDKSRSDKSRDDKKSSSSSSLRKSSSSSSSHRKSSHRDDSRSRDKDRSKYDRKEKEREKEKDKDRRSDDKKKREDDKKKKSKSVDDHSKERKKDDRRSNDRDSNERDKSSSTSRSQGESSRRRDKDTKRDGSSKEKYGKEEKKNDTTESEFEGESEPKIQEEKYEMADIMKILGISPDALPIKTEISPPDIEKSKQVEKITEISIPNAAKNEQDEVRVEIPAPDIVKNKQDEVRIEIPAPDVVKNEQDEVRVEIPAPDIMKNEQNEDIAEIPPPDDVKNEQIEENMEKMHSPELPCETIVLAETTQNLAHAEEKLPTPNPNDSPPNINLSGLLKEGSIKKHTFPTVADDFYQKFDSVGFKYFEDWEGTYYDCEDEFQDFVKRAENDLSLISDDESDSENDFKEMNSVTVRNYAHGIGNFDGSLMLNPVSGDFYSWTNKSAYENALNRDDKNLLVVPHIETDEDEQTKEEKNKENQELKKSPKKKSNKPKKEDAQKNVLKHITDGLIKNDTVYKEIFKTDDIDVKSALEPEKKLNEVPDENNSLPLSEDKELGKSSEEPAISNSKISSSLSEDDPGSKEAPKLESHTRLFQRKQKTPQTQKNRILARLSSSKSDESSDLEQTDEKTESPPVERTRGKRKGSVEVDTTPSKKLAAEANVPKSIPKPKIRCGLPRPKPKMKAPVKDVDSPVNTFSLPLSPESDDTPLNNGAPNPVLNKRKRAPFTSPNVGAIPLKKNMESGKKRTLQQKYDSQDLYKPRPILTGSRTRNRSLGISSPTTKADSVQNNS